MAAAIEVSNLTKSYGKRPAVDGLSLSVPAGTIYGFLGPNGSGKTTTIRVLMGLMRPSAGVARVQGLDCWAEATRIHREVGYLPGDVRCHPWMTCRSGLRLAAAMRRDRSRPWASRGSPGEPQSSTSRGGSAAPGTRPPGVISTGLQLAEYFELDPDVPASKMSRGMRQKLGLILALAHRPKLLILDEPTASLDPIMQSRLYDHLRRFAAEGGTVFLSSHTLSEVAELCGRVAILRLGRLVAEDTIDNLRMKAGRTVTIRWRPDADSASIQPPPGLHVLTRAPACWEATLTGPSTDVIKWCATQPITDLSISNPDLSGVFRRFYE